ncbi:curli assembly protein CsgF [Vibrio sp. C8]
MKTLGVTKRHSQPEKSNFGFKKGLVISLSLIICNFIAAPTFASKLTYKPINPTFGGNPLNTSHLFARAEAINDYEDPDRANNDRSSVSSLLSSLQSRLLGQLISSGEPGSLETDDYTLTITDNDGFLTITVFDKTTGESTTIEVTGL